MSEIPGAVDPLLQFFNYGHLPKDLQDISGNFHSLAIWIVVSLPRNPERTVALRKLLEAKDCAVRAFIYNEQLEPNPKPTSGVHEEDK